MPLRIEFGQLTIHVIVHIKNDSDSAAVVDRINKIAGQVAAESGDLEKAVEAAQSDQSQ